ncbi:MAG: hypothetical protein ACREMQ_23080, partial [Longimicrobiales bacterium]
MFEKIFEFLFKYRPLVFAEGRLVFAAPTLVVLVVVIAGAAALATLWTYHHVGGKANARDRAFLAGLRVIILAFLLFLLFRPTLMVSSVVPQQNYVGILVDDSRSMRIADGGDSPRSAFVQETFGADGSMLKALAEKFQLRVFAFSSTAGRVADVGQLSFDGGRTQIAPALDRAREELSPVPLSGLVLITDGADNSHEALTESLLALKAAQVPVYTVGVGREQFDKDIELSRVATPRTVLKGSSLVVDLMLAQAGYAGQKVTIFVEDAG